MLEFGLLSEFKNRKVEYFKSVDIENTSKYFTSSEIPNAYFELLRFEYNVGMHQIYIRKPKDNFFTEVYQGGLGSSWGNMMIAHGQDVLGRDVFSSSNQVFSIYSHGDNLLLSYDNSTYFNFMKKSEIPSTIYQQQYKKIPETIRSLAYCYKLKDQNTYIYVDFPKYNHTYSNHRFLLISNGVCQICTISKFVRSRDGGTTTISVIDNGGDIHTFFSPTPFNKVKIPTWDSFELIECTEDEQLTLSKLI